MTVHRIYEGYPPDALHWAPGDPEPVNHTTLYDHHDRPWRQGVYGWFRDRRGPLAGSLLELLPQKSLTWLELVQRHGPMSSAAREAQP